ncbi:MAG: 50S ribosomal protein L9 [Selenomonadaceae bacterium]|nr:50S ribosomal protein L9 [Selenomonadaceae bacterium]
MFSKTDFWIGLAVGAVAGIFGYKFFKERDEQMELATPEIPLEELQRQKEELEDLIAAQQAKAEK